MTKSKLVYPSGALLLDQDGVISRFADKVLEQYNLIHNGNLKIEQWDKFNVAEVFGDEIWAKMEEIYNAPGFFASLDPYPNSLETIREVLKLVKVTLCTTPTKRVNALGNKEVNQHCLHDKAVWIHKHLPELSARMIMTCDKSDINATFLVDDGYHNLISWCYKHPNGIGYLVAQNWNKHDKLSWNMVRAPLDELPAFIHEKLGKTGLSKMTD